MGGWLAGRDAEVAALRAILAAGPDVRAPVVFVAGEAGAGKTALVEHVLNGAGPALDLGGVGSAREPGVPGSAREPGGADPALDLGVPGSAQEPGGAGPALDLGGVGSAREPGGPGAGPAGAARAAPGLVLSSRAAEFGPAAYQPVAELLRQALATAPGPVPGILAVILPELGAPPDDVSLAAVAGALCAALTRAGAGGPAVALIDDLQWADQATLDLLPAFADAARGSPVLLLACYRSDELPRDHRLRQVRAELRRRHRLAEISLPPLSAAAVRSMLAALLGAEPEPGLAAAVIERADGIPFAVQELALALKEAGGLTRRGRAVGLARTAGAAVPDGVREAVLLRTAKLPAGQRSLLEAAAVAGAEFDVDLAAELAGQPAWSDELAGSGLVTEAAGTRAAFRHVLTRDAVYGDIPWSRRRELHRRLAGRLAAGRGNHGLVAAHLLAARDYDAARDALLAEAAAHRAVHAYRDAGRALRGALDIWPPGTQVRQRLVAVAGLAHCAEMCADHAESVSLLRELAESSQRAGDQRGLADASRRLALAHEMLGQWDAALAAREAAAAAFSAAGDPAEAAAERLAAATHLRSAAAFSAALDLLAAARADAEASGRTDLLLRIDGLRGNVLSRLGRAAEGIGAVRDALDRALAQAPGDELTGAAAELQQRLADALEHAGDYQTATAAYASAYQFCDAHGVAATGQVCRACVTVVLFSRGQWNRAAGVCADVLDSADSPPHARAVSSGVLGLILAWRGETARARPLLLESRSIATRIELTAMELLSGWGLCVLDDSAGAVPAAADRARLLLARWQQTEERHYAIPVLQWMSAFFAEHGAADQVRACAAALARIAELTAQPEALAALAHALGETARIDAGARVAAAELLRSVQLFGPLAIPLATATAQRRAAAALLQAGEQRRSVSLLSSAYQAADRLGAAALRARLDAELAGLGEKPRRRGNAGRGTPSQAAADAAGLSARETEVMRLVAEGNTSREIASQLFLSPRTVEMHVRSGMLKLDCRTRAAAVRRIAELGLLPRPDQAAGD